jgi:hypothetical protein
MPGLKYLIIEQKKQEEDITKSQYIDFPLHKMHKKINKGHPRQEKEKILSEFNLGEQIQTGHAVKRADIFYGIEILDYPGEK